MFDASSVKCYIAGQAPNPFEIGSGVWTHTCVYWTVKIARVLLSVMRGAGGAVACSPPCTYNDL